jgi:heterodisulfide reductase subunit A
MLRENGFGSGPTGSEAKGRPPVNGDAPPLNGDPPIRIGVYVCHCGTNIARTVDVERVTEKAGELPGVTIARDYKYMCSDPGQEMIREDIEELGLNRIVVASCSPNLHEETFRGATAAGGLNPFFFQMVNIREHASWVHEDRESATEKAIDLVRAAVRRVRHHKALETRRVPIQPQVLVVGGGIAGITAALTLADAGKRVYLVEREAAIGGHMAQFDKTFPTLDCAACILTPKMTQVKAHPNITLMTMTEVVKVDGFVGSYEVTVKHRPRYIDVSLCVGCQQCIDACVYKRGKFEDEFDAGLSKRKPIYLPNAQAVPQVVLIDPGQCIQFSSGKCKQTCLEACDRDAIFFDQEEQIETLDVGAIIMATGFQTFDARRSPHYGYGIYPNVYTALEVERLVNASGPTGGEVVLRDGEKPTSVGIVHCVGSRDQKSNPWCSKVCCMYSLKLAHLIKEKTDAEVYNFYIDMRTPGKGFEEFYQRIAAESPPSTSTRTGTASLSWTLRTPSQAWCGGYRSTCSSSRWVSSHGTTPRRSGGPSTSRVPATAGSWSATRSWRRSTRLRTACIWPGVARDPRTSPRPSPKRGPPPARRWRSSTGATSSSSRTRLT